MTMSDLRESELELALEDEFGEGESSPEGEGWLGAIGNAVGSLLGEEESSMESSQESSLESALESALESSFESSQESALESTLESSLEAAFEGEEGEQFFGKIGRLIKRAAPLLKRVAKVAAP